MRPRSRIPRSTGTPRMDRALSGFRLSGGRSEQAPPRTRRLQGRPPVSADELEQVAREYRHVHEEHHRAQAGSRVRRETNGRLREIRDRFERLLGEAALSDEDRERWRDRLRGVGEIPSSPAAVPPVLFCGRSDAGSELRLTIARDGTIDAAIDGVAVAVLDDAPELTATEPGFVFAFNGWSFRETFAATAEAIADLREGLETGGRLAPERIRELIEDGLIDRTLGLTTRGRRALALDSQPARQAEEPASPEISTRGKVSRHARDKLARAIADAVRSGSQPVLRTSASLTRHEDPALPRPYVAKAAIAFAGRAVRVQVKGATENETIALLEERLRRTIRDLADRARTARRRTGVSEPGEWRHGDVGPPRPPYEGE